MPDILPTVEARIKAANEKYGFDLKMVREGSYMRFFQLFDGTEKLGERMSAGDCDAYTIAYIKGWEKGKGIEEKEEQSDD